MIIGLRRTGGREYSLNICCILESFKTERKTAQKPWSEALSETFLQLWLFIVKLSCFCSDNISGLVFFFLSEQRKKSATCERSQRNMVSRCHLSVKLVGFWPVNYQWTKLPVSVTLVLFSNKFFDRMLTIYFLCSHSLSLPPLKGQKGKPTSFHYHIASLLQGPFKICSLRFFWYLH